MTQTPDRRPGALEEDEEIRLEANASAPTIAGALNYNGTAFQLRDSIGVYDPRASAGITSAAHRTLLQLIHFIDQGPALGFTTGAVRTTTGTVFPSQVLWKRADTTKLVEKNLTYTGSFPTTIQWKLYDTDGTTVLETVTDTISYTGAFETSRTRAIA